MKLNIGFQMDPLEGLNIKADSTYALMVESIKRGYNVWHFLPEELTLKNNSVFSKARKLSLLNNGPDNVSKTLKELTINLNSLDAIFLRQDPPFDMSYITSAHLLETIQNKVKIINKPSEVRNAPEKLFLNRWPDLIPKTLISRAKDEIISFREEFKDIIIKPLYGNGGSGVFFVKEDDKNFSTILEMFFEKSKEPIIIQEFLKEIDSGDKRIILIDGKPEGAINRIPKKNEVRANMHVGGVAQKTCLTDRENYICSAIGPELKRRGLLFVGIDVIGDKLTEINVTSPTGIKEINNLNKINLAEKVIDLVDKA